MPTIEYRIRGILTACAVVRGHAYQPGETLTIDIGDQDPIVVAGIYEAYLRWPSLTDVVLEQRTIGDWTQMAPAPGD